MPINFPATPSTGDYYTYNSKTYVYKGSYWVPIGANPQDVYTKTGFVATSGQTSFTVAYIVGYVDVWLNGVKLTTDDYTATSGTAIVLGTGATLNDVVEVLSWNPMALSNGVLVDPAITNGSFTGSITEEVYAVSGTTPALNPTNGTIQTWTLTGNSTPTDSLSTGEYITLMIDDGTAYTITWPTMQWAGGSAPTLATTGYTVVELWKVGTTLYGAPVGDMS